ncbi:hypothetical protein BEWA_033960 [Theileria equi strain WA]|uniref:Uncharacterized protein n=1 Tax=Theileria equi strain WA TaxID=1537102 RepID=L0B078_THEEQ|nr:hypothetical protein BEWA_033960 [Theileria equi strain WA]AFZ80539.1 hypothetical protein BEWA_033960 [Theileria equi strain WA]|eukprot:XP_004830205.1 hypothetical protein BEWA_033960 [Theileria equi strain WA]
MEPLEQLRSQDSFRYLGVNVSITMITGEVLTGELYCMDMQKGQTIVIKSKDTPDSSSIHIIRATSIKKFEVFGRLNESLYDIPRINYDDLAYFKPLVVKHNEENHSRRNH